MSHVLSRVEQGRIALINVRCHALIVIFVVVEKLFIAWLVLVVVVVDEILQDFLLLESSRPRYCCVRIEYGVFQVLHEAIRYGPTAIMGQVLTRVVTIRQETTSTIGTAACRLQTAKIAKLPIG